MALADPFWPRAGSASPTAGSDWMDLRRPAWMAAGACRSTPELEFVLLPPGVSAERLEELRNICRGCPVIQECLDYAIADESLVGIWGGADERERREYRRAPRRGTGRCSLRRHPGATCVPPLRRSAPVGRCVVVQHSGPVERLAKRPPLAPRLLRGRP